MAEKFLGHEFEIHGGGNDLRFPHHENELAQSRSLGHAFARIWMHNGMLELDAAKMSKSLGNVVTLRNVLDVWGREALLVFHLSGFWSKPVDFDDAVMQQAAARADRFRDVFRDPHAPAPEGAWKRFSERSRTTSTPRQRSRSCTNGGITSCCGAPSSIFGLESLAEAEDVPPDIVGARWATSGRAGGARVRRGRPPALGDRESRLGSA